MKVILTSIGLVALIAITANFALKGFDETSAQKYAGPNVRLGSTD